MICFQSCHLRASIQASNVSTWFVNARNAFAFNRFSVILQCFLSISVWFQCYGCTNGKNWTPFRGQWLAHFLDKALIWTNIYFYIFCMEIIMYLRKCVKNATFPQLISSIKSPFTCQLLDHNSLWIKSNCRKRFSILTSCSWKVSKRKGILIPKLAMLTLSVHYEPLNSNQP